MLVFAFLPEIAAFLLFILTATQMPQYGTVLVLAQFALFGLVAIIRSAALLQTALRWWPLLLVAILALASALWSDAPAASLRYGAQLLFTAFMGVHLARLMSPRRFVTVFMLSMLVFCVLCVLGGQQGISAEGMVLIGLTGSKNQLAYAAQLLMMSGLTVLLLGAVSAAVRWAAVLTLPLAVYLLLETNSATAVLMALGGSFVLIMLWFSQRLAPGGRLAALIGALLVLAPLTALAPEASAWMNHFVFDTLGKDPTLTGRTLLWARADELIAQRPLLGYGYQAIWMGDSFETIGLKRLTGIADGRVFHFHHMFRQVAVDTGLVGLAAFIGALVASGLAGLRQVLLYPTPATSFFFAVFLLMVARAFTDSIMSPFSVHTVIFFACGVYAFRQPESGEQAVRAPHLAAWEQARRRLQPR
jgi:exopolysaccharide production protein ExoQ